MIVVGGDIEANFYFDEFMELTEFNWRTSDMRYTHQEYELSYNISRILVIAVNLSVWYLVNTYPNRRLLEW